MIICPKCGEGNEDSDKVCKACGTSFKEVRPFSREEEESSPGLIIVGYALALLGVLSLGISSIFGLVIGIVLRRKDDSKAKFHGLIIIIISIVILVSMVLAIYFALVYGPELLPNTQFGSFFPRYLP